MGRPFLTSHKLASPPSSFPIPHARLRIWNCSSLSYLRACSKQQDGTTSETRSVWRTRQHNSCDYSEDTAEGCRWSAEERNPSGRIIKVWYKLNVEGNFRSTERRIIPISQSDQRLQSCCDICSKMLMPSTLRLQKSEEQRMIMLWLVN